MKTTRKRRAISGGESRSPSNKRGAESTRGGKSKTKRTESDVRPNSKVRDLPPNENIRKRADEVYGDTEISERKPGT
jgi:hypothetical protein